MKTKYIYLLLLCICFAACRTECQAKPVVESDYLPIADPYIMFHEGKYYAYGTGGTQEGEGFACFSSDDLQHWKRESQALYAKDSYGTWGFWAPEVYYVESKKKFYLFYSAAEHICVATADRPQGPFRQEVKQPIWDEKSIDTSLFIDDDGTPYLYFVRFTGGNVIWVAQMNDDLTSIKQETLKECIRVGSPWELSQDKPAKVAEGPSLLKKDGVYYMVYSANHFESKNYGVGYATSASPMGPWKKYDGNPILQRTDGLYGTGHGAPFCCKDGSWKYIFHAHWNGNKVQPRTSYIKDFAIADEGIVSIGGPIIRPQVVSDTNTTKDKQDGHPKNMYRNPVVDYSLPDPTIIKANDGYFYLYATEDIRNLPIHRSKDLVKWEYVGTAFTERTRPNFEEKGGLWAPDISKIGDKYVMHYSMSVWGGEWTCGIGCATADKPEGPFTDHGKLFRSNEINVQNSIDPFYIEDGGKKYLFWGSFRGIYAIELTDDGLALKEGAKPQQVAGTAYEGTYIHKKDGYYYFFASIGTCCEGLKSTYTTVVGRSQNLFGPYVDKNGGRMLDNKHEVLIAKNNSFVGVGHNSEIVTDDAGTDWMFYHGVSTKKPEGRVLMLDQVEWKDGWPSVQGSTPSTESEKPAFN